MQQEKLDKTITRLYNIITGFVQPHPEVNNHGTQHWLKVATAASALANLAGEDDALITAVIAAGLIHDIGRVADSSKKDPEHGANSVKIAEKLKLCEKLGVERKYWNALYDAVRNHTFGVRSRDPVAMYLWDADRLVLLGFQERLLDEKRMSSAVWRQLCR